MCYVMTFLALGLVAASGLLKLIYYTRFLFISYRMLVPIYIWEGIGYSGD